MIVCGIASLPARVDNLKLVLESIAPQVDIVHIALNNYSGLPPWHSQFANCKFELSDNRLSDAHKFNHADKYDCYYVSLDDDLLVPPTFVEYLCSGVDRYNGVCGLHGRRYLVPVTNFKHWAGAYRCLNTVTEDIHVNFIGSGCTAFHTSRLKLSLSDFKSSHKADVWLSKACTEQGIPMIVLKHNIGYLQYLPPKGKTIWEQTKDYSEHVRVMRTFIR